MTELQPSPAAYRGQDEAPGPPSSCTQNKNIIKYPGHNHKIDSTNYKNINLYPQENYQQQLRVTNTSNDHQYRHNNNNNNNTTDRRNTENDDNNVDNGKKLISYNDGFKKNTPGYKNDSGYSESIGFDSFSIALNERDSSSPPPTPPVRDASSLKGVCYGPGHEKYPSWPSAPECNYNHDDKDGGDDDDDDDNDDPHKNGSHRSKSWTDHTNYPKEKPQQYSRPSITKRANPTFTQQLKTVMERCEKIPAETFESRGLEDNRQQQQQHHQKQQPRPWPRVDREGKLLGDAEYVVPSPPEREQDQPGQTLSHADLEAYVRSYQDPSSQVDIYRETTLTQAGLEEYTRVQHSQQASYAQSEGYHSYVSSVDSTTTTPFLDRLRRDSEAVAQRAPSTWEDTSSSSHREGRDSVVTTSSGGSASSSETLKWHGSMSDVSLSSSGLQSRSQIPSTDNWQHGSLSDISLNGNSINIKKSNCHDKWPGSMCDVSKNIVIKNKNHQLNDKWQLNMNDRNCKQNSSRISLPGVISHCSSVNDVCNLSGNNGKWQESNIDDDDDNDNDDGDNNQHVFIKNKNNTGQRKQDEWNNTHSSMSDVSQMSTSINGNSKQLIAHSARVQTPQRHHSESVLYLDRERNKRKLYPISTTQIQDDKNNKKTSSPTSQVNLSVADRINELEKQQQIRYTYLDPNKRHRVSDPRLKAIQKQALLSFYERHHHQSSWRSEPHLLQSSNNQLSLSQSSSSSPPPPPPPQPPPRPRPVSSRRASSASDYANGTWRDKKQNQSLNNDSLPVPKHQHSNSCGSLSTDLLSPVIVGPAISIDDWVPERPPKKPHLRAVFNNERLPSPDLPPPSPPTVTVNEVLNCDDPLPPPPPELNDFSPPESIKDNLQQYDDKKNCKNFDINLIRKSKKKTFDLLDNHLIGSLDDQNIVRGSLKSDQDLVNENCSGYGLSRSVAGRSSLRYPSTQKLMINGRGGLSRRSVDDKSSLRPAAVLPDLLSQRYNDSGHQRAAPQVPIESSRIIRQESMRIEGTKYECGLSTSGQRPQPQVPKITTNGIVQNCNQRINYLSEVTKTQKYLDNGGFSVGSSPVKTGYEANSKLIHEGNPQKYHEPPKYNMQQRNYFALPPKYVDAPVTRTEGRGAERSQGSPGSPPPPLVPRKNTPGRKSLPPPPRPAPPLQTLQGSTSKASYLAYRRERGAPDSEGSYKRTMSPTARLEDWPPLRERDDPVLLRVTPYNQNINERTKSHSVDSLHSRIEERTNAHTVEVIGKLSQELSKKLQSTEQRNTRESNNNCTILNNNDTIDKKYDNNDKLSPKNIKILNDKNQHHQQQYERERRKNVVSCDPINQSRLLNDYAIGIEDFYRERSATIEMTSRNVELLNRRNQNIEKRHSAISLGGNIDKSFIDSSSSIDIDNNITRPPPPSTSPPRSPEPGNYDDNKSRGAISRISESTSSLSSSASTRNSLESNSIRNNSPGKININDQVLKYERKSPKEHERLINVEKGVTINSRFKVSSPSQTDSSWMKYDLSNNDILFRNNLHRTSSLGSRSSTLSSASKTSSSSSSTSLSPRYSPIERKQSPCVSPQPGFESLQLVQRSEIVVRVNTTIDASSQTDLIDDDKLFKSHDIVNLLSEPRKKLPEEIECEELSRDLVNQLGPNDKLAPILVPAPEHKKPTDYVSGLFRVEATVKSRLQRPGSTSSSLDNDTEDERKNDTMPTTPQISEKETSSPLSPTSAYFTTSESKARFLTRYSRDVTDVDVKNSNDTSSQSSIDNLNLRQKKEELVLRLDRKVVVLRAEQEAVREEVEMNEALGAKVATRITAVARQAESSKFRLHVEEIGKITSLLLGLSGRLARAENALYGMSDDHPERKILESKRDKLLDQLEEAKILKVNIDKRSVNVSSILLKYLNDDEFADYQHFINMKTKLIMDGREIEDKVKLGEEQLAALKEAIS